MYFQIDTKNQHCHSIIYSSLHTKILLNILHSLVETHQLLFCVFVHLCKLLCFRTATPKTMTFGLSQLGSCLCGVDGDGCWLLERGNHLIVAGSSHSRIFSRRVGFPPDAAKTHFLFYSHAMVGRWKFNIKTTSWMRYLSVWHTFKRSEVIWTPKPVALAHPLL